VTLRELRKTAGLTAAAVAEKLGVNKQTIYHYEWGNREISLEKVIVLAKIYDVTIEEIVYAQLNSRQSDR
jgi:DNA-binding XRE family transcriptional regulator